MLKLQSYKFSGNVRELQNIIKNAVVLSESDLLDDFLAESIRSGKNMSGKKIKSFANLQYPLRLLDKIQNVEKDILTDAVARFKSTRKIARNLRTSQSSVMRKLKKYNLNRK